MFIFKVIDKLVNVVEGLGTFRASGFFVVRRFRISGARSTGVRGRRCRTTFWREAKFDTSRLLGSLLLGYNVDKLIIAARGYGGIIHRNVTTTTSNVFP